MLFFCFSLLEGDTSTLQPTKQLNMEPLTWMSWLSWLQLSPTWSVYFEQQGNESFWNRGPILFMKKFVIITKHFFTANNFSVKKFVFEKRYYSLRSVYFEQLGNKAFCNCICYHCRNCRNNTQIFTADNFCGKKLCLKNG